MFKSLLKIFFGFGFFTTPVMNSPPGLGGGPNGKPEALPLKPPFRPPCSRFLNEQIGYLGVMD